MQIRYALFWMLSSAEGFGKYTVYVYIHKAMLCCSAGTFSICRVNSLVIHFVADAPRIDALQRPPLFLSLFHAWTVKWRQKLPKNILFILKKPVDVTHILFLILQQSHKTWSLSSLCVCVWALMFPHITNQWKWVLGESSLSTALGLLKMSNFLFGPVFSRE